jgi:pimeloyl-ACP methyl ester carboxylesterase
VAAGGPGAAVVEGRAVPYFREGTGRPLVFVHGSITDHRIWDAPTAPLVARFTVIRPTMRWFGASPWEDGGAGFSADAHAQELGGFLEALGLAPATLVGWSYGGAVCLALAARRPDLVAEMALHEPSLLSALTDPEERDQVMRDRADMFGVSRARFEAGALGPAVEAFVDGVVGEPGTFAALPEAARRVFLRNARTLGPFFAGPPPPSVTAEDLARIDRRTLLLLGERSRATWRSALPAMAGIMPGAELRRVPGAGHLWPIQAPEAFAAAVAEAFA